MDKEQTLLKVEDLYVKYRTVDDDVFAVNGVSLELNRGELSALDRSIMEVPVYGYLPVMITAQCMKKNTNIVYLLLTIKYRKMLRTKKHVYSLIEKK